MRTIAKKKGMTLTQHGLFELPDMKRIKITSENGYFDALGMKVLHPIERGK